MSTDFTKTLYKHRIAPCQTLIKLFFKNNHKYAKLRNTCQMVRIF